MDEKTEQLREIFMDVADDATVTERQEADRGSLPTGDDADERVHAVIAEMRDRYEFSTGLDDDALVRVVRGYYGDETDTEIGDALDVSRETVARARLDLHLVRERDRDAPFELSALRTLLDEGGSVDGAADELGVSPSTVRRYRRVIQARTAARQVSERFRSEFEDALGVVSEGFTDEATEDGLEDATEGMETNVSF
jgi:hypothetical protein